MEGKVGFGTANEADGGDEWGHTLTFDASFLLPFRYLVLQFISYYLIYFAIFRESFEIFCFGGRSELGDKVNYCGRHQFLHF